jgi:hypothetical protein
MDVLVCIELQWHTTNQDVHMFPSIYLNKCVGLLYFLWIKLAKGQLSMPYHISIIVRYNLNSPIYKKCIMPNFKSLVC